MLEELGRAPGQAERRASIRTPAIYEVVQTLDLEPITPEGGDGGHESFKFRIEVLRDRRSGEHLPRVYRHETFRIRPTYPLPEEGGENQAFDEEILVRDTARDWGRLRGRSAEEVVDAVLAEIREVFGLE